MPKLQLTTPNIASAISMAREHIEKAQKAAKSKSAIDGTDPLSMAAWHAAKAIGHCIEADSSELLRALLSTRHGFDAAQKRQETGWADWIWECAASDSPKCLSELLSCGMRPDPDRFASWDGPQAQAAKSMSHGCLQAFEDAGLILDEELILKALRWGSTSWPGPPGDFGEAAAWWNARREKEALDEGLGSPRETKRSRAAL